MSFFSVPPPYDDDHEDVAWALRAASAQWNRDARQDAIHWIRRASETAQEVGAVGRAQELSRLATMLTNAAMPAVAPPPPPGAVAPPAFVPAVHHPPHASVTVDYEIVDVDVEIDDLDEELEDGDDLDDLDDDDDIELIDEDGGFEEIEDVAEVTPAPVSVAPQGRSTASSPLGYRPVPPPTLPPPGRTSMPPSSRSGQGTQSSIPLSDRPTVNPAGDRGREGTRRTSSAPASASGGSGVSEGPRSSRSPSGRLRAPGRSDSTRPPDSARSPSSTRPGVGAARTNAVRNTQTGPEGTIHHAPSHSDSRPERSRPGRTTTPPKLDRIPPSMRPEPSGLDLDEEIEREMTGEGRTSRPPGSGEEYDELQFSDEVITNRRKNSSLPPPIPDLGPLPLETSSVLPIENQTAAEYAQGRRPVEHDHEALERELGVDLSVRGVNAARSAAIQPSPRPSAMNLQEDTGSLRPSGYPSSAPPGVISGVPSADSAPPSSQPQIPELDVGTVSPVPGRIAVRPITPSQVPRITSATHEPYALAPSASLPPVATSVAVIEPPSRPTAAPPPSSMSEPGDRYHTPIPVPGFAESDFPPASAAPDADEFEELFSKISIPPTHTRDPASARKQAVGLDGPSSNAPTVRPQSIPAQPLYGADGSVMVDGLDLMSVEGFQDLPEESALALAEQAELRTLEVQEEISGFGLAIVTHGAVSLMPSVANATCRVATKGQVLFTQGTLEGSASVRIVGLEQGSRVAVFNKADLDRAVVSCPWVGDELAAVADTHLAFAGAALGPLGHSLDEVFRFMVLEKCTVKRKGARDVIAIGGKPMDGMYILGGGSLEVVDEGGTLLKLLSMGDFVFPETVLSAAPAEHTVRAGPRGALVLYAPRKAAHELLATCPPFIELLAR